MSIRTRILVPLFAFLILAGGVCGLIGTMSLADHSALQLVVDKALGASEASRAAREQFDRAEQVVAQVTAMTDLLDMKAVSDRYTAASEAATTNLTRLETLSLSPEMTAMSRKAAQAFMEWHRDAQVLLGLRKATEIPTLEILGRRSRSVRAMLNDAVALAGTDAKTGVAEAGTAMRTRFVWLFACAGLVGIAAAAGAVWIVRSLTRPLIGLVVGAKRLAAGDVGVALNALARRDEIGEIARAIDLFRANVTAQAKSEQEAGDARHQAEANRTRDEAERKTFAAEQARVVTALAGALANLSKGDLTCRLDQAFAPEYEQLRADFNAAIGQLRETISVVVTNARRIRSGSGEISHSAEDLSRRTEQQAASLEETAAALDQITATVKRTADGARHVREVVSTTRTDAERSGATVRNAVGAMGEIDRSAREISQIIGVIDEIAFQTNLLALNAGVEAARAGEAGRGFAVVASEVRALAQRSADAAKEIKTLIRASTGQVAAGVELVGETGRSLERIIVQIAEIAGIVGDIAASASEQSTGLSEVNAAVNQMDQVTQQNAAMVEHSSAASRTLAQEADQLSQLIGHFQVGQEAALPATRPTASRAPVLVAQTRAAQPRRAALPVRGNLALKPTEPNEDGWEEF